MNTFKLKASVAVLLPLFIGGCGGGAKPTSGSGVVETPTVQSVTVICPNGTSKTSTTQTAAELTCAAPVLLSITPANGVNTVSPASFAGVTVTSDADLGWSSIIAAGNVSLKVGNLTNVPGQLYFTSIKSFKFVPSAPLQYGVTYNFSALVTDTLGKTFTVNTSFTTPNAVCVAPTYWNGTSCASPVTLTCPNGSSQTANTQALAQAACPAPALVSVTPANAVTNVATNSSVTVVSDSTLDPASVTTGNVSLSLGGGALGGTTVMQAGGKGFVFTPATQLQNSTVYNLSVNVTDTLGKALVVNSNFTTIAPIACTAPAMLNSMNVCMSPPAPTGYTWNSVLKAWVADIGTLVIGANLLPAGCVTIGDACWLQAVADGTIKFANTGLVMTGLNSRPIVFAYYHVNAQFGAGTPVYDYYLTKPIYADVQASTPSNSNSVSNSGGVNVITEIKGSSSGLKMAVPPQGCGEYIFFTQGLFFGMILTTCPI